MRSAPIQGILCDIGGVLYVGERPIRGAIEAVACIRHRYRVRFVTNTTQKTGAQIVQKLQEMGFEIQPEEVITALDVTRQFLEREGAGACYLLTDDGAAYFRDLPEAPCRYVVVGDAQENFSYDRLNRAFRVLMGGGVLLAAAKNRYFKDSDGELSMDAGGFVAALEYACNTEARIIGKPSREFYHLACASMGIPPEACVMIGDDIESDILGAQEAGLKAALVKTGKFTADDLLRGIIPDAVIDSIADFSLLG